VASPSPIRPWVLSGEIMTLPGLPKKPASDNIDIDADGNIVGRA
jgi:formate--tetrahydrofolate ligase